MGASQLATSCPDTLGKGHPYYGVEILARHQAVSKIDRLLLFIGIFFLFTAEPVDYDELVGADSLADPMISAMDTSQVTMEDSNRILSLNDDDLDD